MEKYIPLNFAIIGNPINWFIVVLMVAIAVQGLALLGSSAKQQEG